MIQYQTDHLVVFESRFYRTTSSLLIQSDHYILVDPNWHPEELAEIKTFVDTNCKGKEGYLVFTHADYDHIVGYPLFKKCKTIASHAFVHLRDHAKCLEGIRSFDIEQHITRDYELEYPKIDIVINDSIEKVSMENQTYTFYRTPGHTVDGLSFYCEKTKVLFVGDHLSDIEFPFVGDSIFSYQNTLDILQAIIDYQDVIFLVPGHGNVMTAYEVMNSRLEESRRYLQRLREHILNESKFDWNEIVALYPEADLLKEEHDKNVNLVRNELET